MFTYLTMSIESAREEISVDQAPANVRSTVGMCNRLDFSVVPIFNEVCLTRAEKIFYWTLIEVLTLRASISSSYVFASLPIEK